MKYILLTLFCLAAWSAGAATYYTSYSTGSDANNGSSTSLATKNPPFAANYSGSISMVNGDVNILKGGDPWPNPTFPIFISSSITIGTNGSWGTGQSIFNAGGTAIASVNAFIRAYAANNVTINGICFTNQYWNTTGQPVAGIAIGNSTGMAILNCSFLGWSHAPNSGGSCTDDLQCLAGSTSAPNYNTGSFASNCVFDGRPNGTDSGTACYAFPQFYKCVAGNMANGFLFNGSPAVISGCAVGPINVSFDPLQHENILENVGPVGDAWITNNYLHDGVGAFVAYGGNGSGYLHFFNNVCFNTNVVNGPILLNLDGRTQGTNSAYVYNNTFDASLANPPLAIGTVSTNLWSNLWAANNLIIGGTQGGTYVYSNVVTTLTLTTNQAQSYGMTPSTLYRSLVYNAPTVGTGVNLTASNYFSTDILGNPRPGLPSAWDIGAYQIQGVPIVGGGTVPIVGGGTVPIVGVQ